MASSNNKIFTNTLTPSQALESAWDRVDDSAANVFLSGSVNETNGPSLLIPTPPIPVTPPTSRAALHEGDAPAPVSTEPVFLFNISSPLSHHAAILNDITPHDAEVYGDTQLARLHDNDSLYFPSVINAIASFLFCQDQLILNDWDVNSHHDDTYPGHPVIVRDPKLPTGGP
jgi:hypothetical protein